VGVGCALCAVCAFALSVMTYMDVSLFGFPDSAVTDYEKAATAPLNVLMWLLAGIGLLFLVLAMLRISTRARAIAGVAALVIFILVAVATRYGVPWYYGTHLGLDNGIGG
jgi:surface polysaccharide O-acyltransferase-like enzyme